MFGVFFNTVESTLLLILTFVSYFIFARLIIEILVMGNILRSNDFMAKLYEFLFRITEPILSFVRSKLPPAPIDISYIVTLLGIMVLKFLVRLVF